MFKFSWTLLMTSNMKCEQSLKIPWRLDIIGHVFRWPTFTWRPMNIINCLRKPMWTSTENFINIRHNLTCLRVAFIQMKAHEHLKSPQETNVNINWKFHEDLTSFDRVINFLFHEFIYEIYTPHPLKQISSMSSGGHF